MAAAGSATNVAKELRTVFGFSFSRAASSNAGRGVTFDGCKIFHMKAGSPALKKGLKIGWVVVAVDSLAVSTESELRAALDECVGRAEMAHHFYKVYCRVDDASADRHVGRAPDVHVIFGPGRVVIGTSEILKDRPVAVGKLHALATRERAPVVLGPHTLDEGAAAVGRDVLGREPHDSHRELNLESESIFFRDSDS